MDNGSINSQVHCQEKEDLSECSCGDTKFEDDSALDFAKSGIPKATGSRPSRRLILKLNKDEAHEILSQDLFIRSWHHLGTRIPKQVISPDEMYLRHCVALILLTASKAMPLTPMGLRSNRSCLPQTLGSSVDIAKPGDGCTMTGVMSPAANWIVGSVMRSDSMMNLLKSPFLIKLGDFDGDLRFDRPSVSDSDDCGLNTSLCHDLENKMLAVSRHVHASYTVGRTPSSVTSTMSMVIEQSVSSSSSSPFDRMGILRSSHDSGVLQFTFSVDGQKELYIAHTVNVGFPDNKSSDFFYVFHRRPDNPKETTHPYKEVVGAMRVSTSISLCPNNTRVRELKFVLSALQDDHDVGPQKLIQSDRRTRKTSKVAELLKGVPLKRSGALKCISGNISSDKSQEPCSTLHSCDGANFLEQQLPPNLELAAIVVKEHLHDDNVHEKEVGGWGLKFLGKGRTRRDPSSSEASPHSESCQQCAGDSFMSTDVIVPAGIHGGPRSISNGPSSLIERWKSGGQCDCGGWDVGCPLKLLHPRPRKEMEILHPEARGESFTLFAQGLEEGRPWLRMINMNGGVNDIGFQSALSALQCFSVAVAVIHSRSSSLRPKNVQEHST